MNVVIEQIRPELTWRLRKEVLYPAEPLYAMEMEEDNHGLHFGAYSDDNLVGIISLFQNGKDYQFRKFAITPGLQGKGIGSKMLQYVIEFVSLQGGTRLWCNARSSAIDFYLRAGFNTTGQIFIRKGISFEILEKQL